MKIYVVGGDNHYADFIEGAELTKSLKEAQVVLFTGGEDVDPVSYDREPVTQTIYSNVDRDLREIEVFKKISNDQLVVGICRGSQFLCVMNGGNLVQDCDGHALCMTHPIYSADLNKVYMITSTHHQMQDPYSLQKDFYKLLYFAKEPMYKLRGDHINKAAIFDKQPEVVLYTVPDKPKCLAIQGHPEMMPNSPVAKMLNNLIKEYVSR